MPSDVPPPPRVRTRAVDAATRRRAAEAAADRLAPGVPRVSSVATPEAAPHRPPSSAAASSNVTTRGSSSPSLSSLSDATPPTATTRAHRAWLLASRLRDVLARVTVRQLLERKRLRREAATEEEEAAPERTRSPVDRLAAPSRASARARVRDPSDARGASRDPSSSPPPALAPEDVLVVQYDEPVGEALRKLSARRVLSAPVVDYSSGVAYRGFLSVADVVLDIASRQSAGAEAGVGVPAATEDDAVLASLAPGLRDDDDDDEPIRPPAPTAANEPTSGTPSPPPPPLGRWALTPVSEVMSAPNWQDGHVLWRADDPTLARLSVFDLCFHYFFHGDPDGPVCHRVAALAPDEDDPHALKCAAIVSMSDVVRLLHDELFAGGGRRSSAAFAATSEDAEEAASLAERVTLDDLGLAASAFAPLVFVDADAPAIRAFEAMTRGGVAFCAAVDERAGEIVANVSASDARGVLPDRIAALSLPLGDYLARAIDSRPGGESSSRGGGAGGTSRTASSSRVSAPLFVHRSSSLADAVRVLCDGGIHHAFVAEDCGGDAFVAEAAAARRARGGLAKGDVVGAVTLADVLRRACFEDAYDAAEG